MPAYNPQLCKCSVFNFKKSKKNFRGCKKIYRVICFCVFYNIKIPTLYYIFHLKYYNFDYQKKIAIFF